MKMPQRLTAAARLASFQESTLDIHLSLLRLRSHLKTCRGVILGLARERAFLYRLNVRKLLANVAGRAPVHAAKAGVVNDAVARCELLTSAENLVHNSVKGRCVQGELKLTHPAL